MKTAIYWFRNDLRLHDQPVLSGMETQKLLPVYVVDQRDLKPHRLLGFNKMGAFRAIFLLESLNDLKTSLQRLGSNLLVLVGDPRVLIVELAKKIKADCVFTQAAHAYHEIKDQQAIASMVSLKLHQSQTLLDPKQLRNGIEKFPDIFTQFRNQVEPLSQRTAIAAPGEPPYKLPSLPEIEIAQFPDLGYSHLEQDKRAAFRFEGGEQAGLSRLESYLWKNRSLSHYKLTRNQLLGSEYSSKFSAYLALGCLSPRKIFEQVKLFEERVEENESTYWLIFELLWRDFFHFTSLKHGKKMFLAGGLKGAANPCHDDKAAFWAWVEGQTGVDFVDANMKELKLTGFMSNRGRQNVASYLCKDLKLDWRWGAAYFEHALLDYDACSNWGNWLYVAGLGNDPREDRYFNIKSQQQRYDPTGKYCKTWLEN